MRRIPGLTTIATLAAVTMVIATAAAGAAMAGPVEGVVLAANTPSAIPDSYLVNLKDTTTVSAIALKAQALASRYDGRVGAVWTRAAHGFSVTMSETDAKRLAADPAVESVIQDQLRTSTRLHELKPAGSNLVQQPVGWGLDRIDQPALPLDNSYAYDDTAGQNANVYILNAGVQADLTEFGGRVFAGPNLVGDNKPSTTDCTGEGTAIAGIVGGAKYGVAKLTRMISVKVFDCQGLTPASRMVTAIDWVIGDAPAHSALWYGVNDYCFDPPTGGTIECPPAEAAMSVQAQENAFAHNIPVVGAAGDESQDACAKSSGAAPHTIHVGATDQSDNRAFFSNFGACLTMFAPGNVIASVGTTGGEFLVTSTAASGAYVLGTVALFLGLPEFNGKTAGQIRDELVVHRSTIMEIGGAGAGSPNRLLYTGPPGFFTIGDEIGLAPTGDGKLQLFAANDAGFLVHRGQTAAGAPTWGPPTQSATKGWESLAAQSNADGRVELLGVDTAGNLWDRRQAPAAATRAAAGSLTWLNWTSLGKPAGETAIGHAVMARNTSNRVTVLVTSVSGHPYYRTQTAAGANTWTAWNPLPFNGRLASVAASTAGDGRVVAGAVDDSGQVWVASQTSNTGDSWTQFTRLNGTGVVSLAIAPNANGAAVLFGVDPGGNPRVRAQAASGSSTWSTWAPLPARHLSKLTARLNPNGLIQVVGLDPLGHIWQTTEASANSTTFPAWTRVDL